MRYKITLLILLFGYYSNSQTFVNTEADIPNLYNSITALGYANGDEYLDLYIAGNQENSFDAGGLYLYDNGTYTLSTTSNLPVLSLGSARWGDIDNDGDMDILIQGYNGTTDESVTKLYENNNDGTFTALEIGLPQTYLGEVAFSDINNDGFLDIAITGFVLSTSDFITKIFKNNGNSSFTELSGNSIPGMNFGRIKFADYNNDGYEDFVLSGMNMVTYEFFVAVFTNNQDETFTEDTSIDLTQNWLGDTEWADYNNDGNIDLIVSGTGGDSGMERTTILYKNNGDNTFSELNSAVFPGVSHSSIEWADFDNDDDLDVLIIGTTSAPGEGNYTYTIHTNNGDDTFTASETAVLNVSYYGDADSGDIDNDGLTDLVISGFNNLDIPESSVYMNQTGVSISEVIVTDLQVFPNPVIGKKLTITSNISQWNFDKSDLTIYSVTGKKVYHKNINSRIQTIDLSILKSGIYMLELKQNKKTDVRKLIIP